MKASQIQKLSQAGEIIGSFLVSGLAMFSVFAVLIMIGPGAMGIYDIGLLS